LFEVQYATLTQTGTGPQRITVTWSFSAVLVSPSTFLNPTVDRTIASATLRGMQKSKPEKTTDIYAAIGRSARMLFSDGECPSCGHSRLSLNTDDFLECQQCHLVCANIDGLVATVMPFLGKGRFRFEDCRLSSFSGTAFAKAQGESVLPNYQAIFYSRAELADYLSRLSSFEATESVAEELWARFQAAFVRRLSATSADAFNIAWSGKSQRTLFYKVDLLPSVASYLGLVFDTEQLAVDYRMCRISVRGVPVPQVFVESENDFKSANHEISKLCSLNAPLRVLITALDGWSSIGAESKGHGKLREWQDVVRAHAEERYYDGVIGVIVGSKVESKVNFRACAFRPDGDILSPLASIADI
jgi:hypothetical protein